MKKKKTGQQMIDSSNEVLLKDGSSLAAYSKFTTPDQKRTAVALARKLKGKRIMFLNSTPHGGGVAIMRHDLIPLLKHLGVDVHWYVLIPDQKAFLITKKKFHDILQGVSPKKLVLTAAEERIYESWSSQNAEFFKKTFESSDIIVIDDMQPSGVIPHIKEANKAAKIVFRSHIQIDTAKIKDSRSPNAKTWQYLWKNISLADIFVSHPVGSFVPKNVPKKKIVFMPPFIDPLSELNREMSEKEIDEKMRLFDRLLKQSDQDPLDLRRPYIVQIARFDPAKGIPDVLAAYKLLAAKLKTSGHTRPQLVLVGNTSVDDPEGSITLNKTFDIVRSHAFDGLRGDIKLAILPPDDLLLNAILRKSKIALQLSTKEGFEFKVTEALMKGKPTIVTNAGGLPLQVKDGVDGYVVPVSNPQKTAKHLFGMITDAEKYKAMSEAAIEYYDRSFLIVPCAIHWMEVWAKLLNAK